MSDPASRNDSLQVEAETVTTDEMSPAAILRFLLGVPNGGEVARANRRRVTIRRGYLENCEQCRAEPSDATEGDYWRIGKRKDAAFCSNACRQKAYRRRKRRDREEWREAARVAAQHHPADPLFQKLAAMPLSSNSWDHVIKVMRERQADARAEPAR